MGFFNKRNKQYTIKEAMEKLKKPKYKGYIAVPVDQDKKTNLFYLIEEEKIYQKGLASNKARNFRAEISNNGEYRKQSYQVGGNYNYGTNMKKEFNDIEYGT